MLPAPDQTALIGLDWGTTSFRAYRLDAEGRVLDRVASDMGILAVTDGDFATALQREIGPWLDGSAPVLACGMIGSRQGWREAPYVEIPAGVGELAGQLAATADGGPVIHFVPGLSRRDADGIPDVIRGEETQLIGAMGAAVEPRLFILPGTHSKWATVADGRIRWFATFMTGEVFAVLMRHSILGRLSSGTEHDPAAFGRGLERAGTTGSGTGGLLHHLFGARSLALFGDLPESCVAAYLSGLLIGTEIVQALRSLPAGEANGPITLIGRSDLTSRYETALLAFGRSVEIADPEASAVGLFRLATAAGLMEAGAA